MEAVLSTRIADITQTLGARSGELVANLAASAAAVETALDAEAFGAAMAERLADIDQTISRRTRRR